VGVGDRRLAGRTDPARVERAAGGGTNLGLIATTLYVLRGAAIVATFAEAFGISALTLLIVAAAAAALAVPLLFVLPGLCTLGITDTWYQYRRRLAEARERQRSKTT